jgi:HD superfamily phosphodiesterase
MRFKSARVSAIEEYVRNHMIDDVVHGFGHVDQVRNHALKIAKAEKYKNLEVVEAAALLHDIARNGSAWRNHGLEGAKIARTFLEKSQSWKCEEVEDICNAVKYHNKNREGHGKLLDILRDADMLNSLGAFGLARNLIFSHQKPLYDEVNLRGETWGLSNKDFDLRFDRGQGIGKYIVDELNFQISYLGNFKTRLGKKMAKPLVNYMKSFILQLEKEVKQNNG